MSYRNSCSRRGVVIFGGMIQWGLFGLRFGDHVEPVSKKSILAKVKDDESKKPTAAINRQALRISTSKNHSFGTEPASVHEIRFYCLEMYDIVFFLQ
jgi:hypothetical protein